MNHRRARAFTLLELMLVIAIIAVLASLLFPAIRDMSAHADSVTCSSRLRQIGIAVGLYVNDHNQTYPYIETDPDTMLLYPPDVAAKSMAETLAPYGLSSKDLQCPADVKDPAANYFAQKGTSYEWRPMVDGESTLNPQVFRRNGVFTASPARVRQVIDFMPVHHGHQNALYADGHIRWF